MEELLLFGTHADAVFEMPHGGEVHSEDLTALNFGCSGSASHSSSLYLSESQGTSSCSSTVPTPLPPPTWTGLRPDPHGKWSPQSPTKAALNTPTPKPPAPDPDQTHPTSNRTGYVGFAGGVRIHCRLLEGKSIGLKRQKTHTGSTIKQPDSWEGGRGCCEEGGMVPCCCQLSPGRLASLQSMLGVHSWLPWLGEVSSWSCLQGTQLAPWMLYTVGDLSRVSNHFKLLNFNWPIWTLANTLNSIHGYIQL